MSTVTAPPLAMTDEQRAALEVMARRRLLAIARWSRPRRCCWRPTVWGPTRWRGAVTPPTSRCGPGVGGSRPKASKVWPDRQGSGTDVLAARGHGGRRRARHPARDARRRLDALDDAAHGRALRHRQGHGRPHLARPQLKPWKVDTFKVSNDPPSKRSWSTWSGST